MNRILLSLLFCLIFPVVVMAAEVTVAWDANTEPDLKGYKIYYGVESGVYDTTVNVFNVLEWTIKDLKPNTTYYLAATAYDEDDNESAYSIELVHTTESLPVPEPDPTPPPKPDPEPAPKPDPEPDPAPAPKPDPEPTPVVDSTPQPTSVEMPELLNPCNDIVVGLSPTFDVYGPNTKVSETRWQILRAVDDSIVLDEYTPEYVYTLNIDDKVLHKDTDYVWKARFVDPDGRESEWSDVCYFATGSAYEKKDSSGGGGGGGCFISTIWR